MIAKKNFNPKIQVLHEFRGVWSLFTVKLKRLEDI